MSSPRLASKRRTRTRATRILPRKMVAMQVRVDINKLNSGKVQIAVFRFPQSTGFVLDYPSPKEAREVLLALGIDPGQVDRTLQVLMEIGPKEPLHFPAQEISDDVLHAHGFRV